MKGKWINIFIPFLMLLILLLIVLWWLIRRLIFNGNKDWLNGIIIDIKMKVFFF